MAEITDHSKELLNTAEAAKVLRVSTGSLERWRCIGAGPRFCKIGHRAYYTRAALDDFIARAERRHTSDTGASTAA